MDGLLIFCCVSFLAQTITNIVLIVQLLSKSKLQLNRRRKQSVNLKDIMSLASQLSQGDIDEPTEL